MADRIFDRIQAIDIDTHITEPPDTWTARVASKWGDAIPRVERNEDGRDLWVINGEMISGPGFTTMAGFNGSIPDSPLGFDDIPKSSWDPKARLEHMDAEGIHAQILYPNVGGFGGGGFLKMGEPEFVLECLRAYNDMLTDWCSVDPNRLVPVASMPFWDVQECVKEVQRTAQTGHKAFNFCGSPQEFDQPLLCDKHWDPLWAAAQETGLSISFHIGGGDISDLMVDAAGIGMRANFARVSSGIFMGNAAVLSNLFFGGICHRFPDLKFVSVESGVGWIPAYLEACDWQWTNGQVTKEHPEYDLLPSEYFRRQVYGSFWFENAGLQTGLELYPDNMLWETDFPHPTCQHPGLEGGFAERPADYAEKALGKVSEATLQKVLHDNAAELYRLS